MNARIALALAILLASCAPQVPSERSMELSVVGKKDGAGDTSDVTESIVRGLAREVVLALQSYDIKELSSMVSPERGLRLSPYPYINVDEDLVWKPLEIMKVSIDGSVHTWGYEDGSGEPIELTFREYINAYLVNQDYLNASEINYDNTKSSGTMVSNIKDVYTDAHYVEYYFPGFDEQYGGLDWESLWVVIQENKKGHFNLVALIHGQWTT